MGFSPPDPVPDPPPSGGARIINFFVENGRGIYGSIPIIVLTVMLLAAQDDLKQKPEKAVLFVYFIIFSCLLFHPIKVPGAAFVPVFAFPLLHVQDSNTLCRTYLCSNTCLLIVGGYLHQIINASGWHKRFSVWMIYGEEANNISSVGMLVKSSVAAYVLSLISSRQHTTKFIMELVVGSMNNLNKEEKDSEPAEPDANETAMRGILAHAISSSSTIGSMGIVIGARNVMVMRSLWEVSLHPDTFNFLDYFCFAFPLSLMMFLLNLIYNIIVAKIAVKDEMSEPKLNKYREVVMGFTEDIEPKVTCHEILSLFFTFLSLILYSTRWSNVMFKITKSRGWADFKSALDKKGNTRIPDVTVAAIMLVICCILPTTFNFLKVWSAKTESDLPPAKPDSSIVTWKFVDKNTNYGYMFLVGSFAAINSGIKRTQFSSKYLYEQLSFITKKELPVSILLWCVIAGALCNIMTSFAASGMLTLIALNSYSPDNALLVKHYQFILATGVGCGFGFFTHFKYTPMYTVKTIANVATLTQIKYNFGSILICVLILWAGIYLYAPLIFE